MKNDKLLLGIITLFYVNSFAFGGGIESSSTVILKKGGAVTEFSKEAGFKLSDKAVKNLGISFTAIEGKGPWKVPKNSLVKIKHSTGVYRKYDKWITLVFVKVLKLENDFAFISSVDLQAKDDIAISGVLFLRMTEADLNSDTVDTCAH